jgi:hypothetical protein
MVPTDYHFSSLPYGIRPNARTGGTIVAGASNELIFDRLVAPYGCPVGEASVFQLACCYQTLNV